MDVVNEPPFELAVVTGLLSGDSVQGCHHRLRDRFMPTSSVISFFEIERNALLKTFGRVNESSITAGEEMRFYVDNPSVL